MLIKAIKHRVLRVQHLPTVSRQKTPEEKRWISWKALEQSATTFPIAAPTLRKVGTTFSRPLTTIIPSSWSPSRQNHQNKMHTSQPV